MSWVAYQLVFRLESPLHAGWRKTGNLMQTRAYVPGRIFWGAATAKLTRCLEKNDYVAIGNMVKDHLRFGYFFLAEKEGNPFIPKSKGGIVYGAGDLPETAFQRRFVSSVVSTVISPDSFSAQEGSLHEVEFISPSPITDSPEAGTLVNLTGHLFVKPNEDIKAEEEITVQGKPLFREVISSLQIGGERRYGFGRITLSNHNKVENGIFGYPLNPENLQITVPKDNPLLAHTCIKHVSALGEVEPLVSREWAQEPSNGKYGPGHNTKLLGICYSPGSISKEKQTFHIGEYGIWKRTE